MKNAIVLVTDGLETCDADPCAIATSLKEGDEAITIYVVGLGLDEEELRITSCIAENSGGRIIGAQNAEELSVALFTFLEELQVVITTGFLEIESIGGLYPLATVSCAGQGATDSDPNAAEPFAYTFTQRNEPGRGSSRCLRCGLDQSKRSRHRDQGQHRRRADDVHSRLVDQVPEWRG